MMYCNPFVFLGLAQEHVHYSWFCYEFGLSLAWISGFCSLWVLPKKGVRTIKTIKKRPHTYAEDKLRATVLLSNAPSVDSIVRRGDNGGVEAALITHC